MRSVKSEIDRQGGVLGSISHVRLALVIIVIALQSIEIAAGPDRIGPAALWPIRMMAISALFALFGFCAAGARERQDPKTFVLHRLRAAYPSYALVILACFLALGPLLSDNGVGGYFRDADSWFYLLNLIGVPTLALPGVLEFNFVTRIVNQMVVLAPAFIVLTIILALASRLGRWRFVALASAMAGLPVIVTLLWVGDLIPAGREDSIRAAVSELGLAALCSGLAGALAQRFAHKLPIDRRLIFASLAVIGTLIVAAARVDLRDVPFVYGGMAVPVAYPAIVFAIRFRQNAVITALSPAIHTALVSAYPIQQVVATASWGGDTSIVNFAVSGALAFALGLAFWWGLDKRLPSPARFGNAVAIAPPPLRLPSLRTIGSRIAVLGWAAGVGLVLAAIIVAVMGLTFYAMQRPPEGI